MRLEWKYTLLINVFILLTMSVFYLIDDRMLEREIVQAVIRDHSRGASMRDIASDIQRRIAGKRDTDKVSNIIRGTKLNSTEWNIVDINVTDANGVIIANLIGNPIHDLLDDNDMKRIKAGQMRVRYPPQGYRGHWVIEFLLPYVIEDNEQGIELGALQIMFSTKEIAIYVRQLRLRHLFYVAIVTVALTIFINPVTSYLIVRRLESLMETITAAQSGDLAVRASDSSRDEIGRLGASINRMIEHISSEHNKRVQSLGNLAAGVAHEVRNPLNSMSITIQYLKDIIGELCETKYKDQESEKDAYECLDVMSRQIKELDRIVEEFLQLARPTVMNWKIVNLNDFINVLMRDFSSRLEVGKARLSCSYSNKPIYAKIDHDKLGQAISNIVINGIQAMPEGGELFVKVSEDIENKKAIIEISDTGIGISQENVDRLFEPYFTTKSDGTGLGLAITHKIIETHNGEIRVVSKEGQGATFSIVLPLYDIIHGDK